MGNRFSERSLADARRSDEAKHGPLHLAYTLLDGEILDDSLLHFLETVVIGIENRLRSLEVPARAASLLPGKRQQPVEISANDGRLGRHRRHAHELREFVLRLLLRLLGTARLGDLASNFLEFVRQRLASELLLDRLHLFVQVVLALAVLHLLLDAAADAFLEAIERHLGFHQTDDPLHPVVQAHGLEDRLAIFELEGKLGGDHVDQAAGFIDGRHRRHRLRRHFLRSFRGFDERFEL